jgi:hypothetical protein
LTFFLLDLSPDDVPPGMIFINTEPSAQSNIEITMVTILLYDFPPLISSAYIYKETTGYCGNPGSSDLFRWVYPLGGQDSHLIFVKFMSSSVQILFNLERAHILQNK